MPWKMTSIQGPDDLTEVPTVLYTMELDRPNPASGDRLKLCGAEERILINQVVVIKPHPQCLLEAVTTTLFQG